MRKYLIFFSLLLLLSSGCARKIPVTVYGNYGYPCCSSQPCAPTSLLLIGSTLSWEGGSYAAVINFQGPNLRQTGYTVEVKEGSVVTAMGSGSCVNDISGDTLTYSETSEPIEIMGTLFSKPHYYIVYYMDNITYYYE